MDSGIPEEEVMAMMLAKLVEEGADIGSIEVTPTIIPDAHTGVLH